MRLLSTSCLPACLLGMFASIDAAFGFQATFETDPVYIRYVNPQNTGTANGLAMNTGFASLDDALEPTINTILQTALALEVEIRLLGNQVYVPDGSHRFPANSTDPRHATFVYPSQVLRISGGWVGTEPGNVPAGRPSILWGNRGNEDDPADNCYHVVVAYSSNQQTPGAQWLKNVIVTAGYADGSNLDAYGGGILCPSGNLRLIDVEVRDNFADYGGGVAAFGVDYGGTVGLVPSSFMARRSSIRDNTAGINGGGLWLERCTSVKLVNMVLRANVAAGNGGGAFLGYGTTDQSIMNAVIYDNVADVAGGGLYVADHLVANVGLRIVNATIAYNSAGDAGGSGLYLEFDSNNTTTPGLSRTLIYNTIAYANPGSTNADNLLLGPSGSATVHVLDFSNGFLGGWATASGTLTNGTLGFGLSSILAATTLEVPGWQNPGARDFRLLSTARCIDQGTDKALEQSFGLDWMDIDGDDNYVGQGDEPMPREHYMGDEQYLSGSASTREVKINGAGAGALPDIGEPGGQVTGAITDIGAFEYRIYATGV